MSTRSEETAHAFWSERRVLVTGGTGLVGSWLVKELLDAGSQVTVLIKDADPQSELVRSGAMGRVSVVNGALEDFFTLEHTLNLHEPEAVFHLGAQTQVTAAYRSPLATFEANVRGTYNLLEGCRQHRDLVGRIVVASTDKAYGAQPVLPYTEEMRLDGIGNPYDASKVCTDILAQNYARAYGLPIAITRFGNVYGGGDLNWNRIVPGAIRSGLQNERLILRSDGTFTRDYIYVRDVARAYMLLAERLDDTGVRGEAFNFSTESPVSVLALLGRIQEMMGCTHLAPDVRNTAQAEIKHQYLSAEKARTRLGWSPAYSLEQGLRETIAWYEGFLNERPPSLLLVA
ncbi:MAG TPA: GDP-mannose 4,6-dehydratase [Rhodothermales bacterium]|nr:GDP-mannose 4,6-dehydratase [Rhodothermales bacterium]